MNRHPRAFKRTWLCICALALLVAGGCRDEAAGPASGGTPPSSLIIWERSAGVPLEPIAALHASSYGTLFASLMSGPVYRSSDAGESWQLLIDTALGTTYGFASVGMTVAAASTAYGMFLSSDNGSHWRVADSGLSDRDIIAVAALAAGTFLAGSLDGHLYRSTSGGATWTTVANPARSINVIAPGPSGVTLLSAWDHGIYRFINASGALEPGDEGLNNPYVRAIAFQPGGYAFASAVDAGIYRSSSGGQSWQPLSGSPSSGVEALLPGAAGELLAGTATGVFVSLDSGLHWTPADSGLTADNVSALVLTPGGTYLAGTALGIFRSQRSVTAHAHTSSESP